MAAAPSYKQYPIESLGMAAVPMIITTAFTNPGGYFKCEYFLAVPDDECFFRAQQFRFNEKNFGSGKAKLDLDFMFKLALQRAYLELLGFTRKAAQEHGTGLYPRRPEVLESDGDLLLSYWMDGRCPEHLAAIEQKTECLELKEDLEWILMLPKFEKRDL